MSDMTGSRTAFQKMITNEFKEMDKLEHLEQKIAQLQKAVDSAREVIIDLSDSGGTTPEATEWLEAYPKKAKYERIRKPR